MDPAATGKAHDIDGVPGAPPVFRSSSHTAAGVVAGTVPSMVPGAPTVVAAGVTSEGRNGLTSGSAAQFGPPSVAATSGPPALTR